MAVYSANRVVKTVTMHKPGCRFISKATEKSCGCVVTGLKNQHKWYCENHITKDDVDEFMNGRFWAILICGNCF